MVWLPAFVVAVILAVMAFVAQRILRAHDDRMAAWMADVVDFRLETENALAEIRNDIKTVSDRMDNAPALPQHRGGDSR